MFGAVGPWKVCEILGSGPFPPSNPCGKKKPTNRNGSQFRIPPKNVTDFMSGFCFNFNFCQSSIRFPVSLHFRGSQELVVVPLKLPRCMHCSRSVSWRSHVSNNKWCMCWEALLCMSVLSGLCKSIFIFHTCSFSNLPLDAIKWSWLPD